MRILEGQEQQDAIKLIEEAAKVAAQSLCSRAHCGAVIIKDGQVIGQGFNSPPQNDPSLRTCLDEYNIPAGFRHDRTCCIHAEQRAIADAKTRGQDTSGANIYFTRVNNDGVREKSYRIVCTICSRAVLDSGIKEFILEWEDGSVRSYGAKEFNDLSYEYKTPKI